MQNIFLILTGMAYGSILLVVVKLVLQFRHILAARVLSFLLLSAACYMIQPFIIDMPNFQLFLNIAGMVSPALFWMFAATLFQSGENAHKLHLGHYLGLFICLGLGTYKCFLEPKALDGSIIHILLLLSTGALAMLGLLDTFRNWQSDLVECRRLLRGGLAITSGAFLLFIVASEFKYGHGEFPMTLNYLNIAIMSVFSMLFGYVFLVSDSNILMESLDELIPELVKDETPKPSLADRQWLDKLTFAMEDEFYYRHVDLTIKSLSEYLIVPEHQLRRLINQHLGYRNFNDYLNRYRIRDAAQRLSNPKLIRTPILTIAIESGYASLTTFNKAFKTLKTMTPTEFRKISGLTSSPPLTDF